MLVPNRGGVIIGTAYSKAPRVTLNVFLSAAQRVVFHLMFS